MAEPSLNGASSLVARHNAMVGLSGPGAPAVPDYFAKILKNKDRIIRVQAKRIELLESEVERLRVARETLSSQLVVVSYKLELATASTTLPVNVIGSQTKPDHQDEVLETGLKYVLCISISLAASEIYTNYAKYGISMI